MISRTITLVPVLAASLLALAVVSPSARSQSSDAIGLMAADVNIAGNAATAFGPVDGCYRAEPGAEFDVDIGVDAIPEGRGMIAFEYRVTYDPALLEVVSSDNGLLLAANGVFEPFIGSQDPFPDKDGSFAISVLDTASNSPNSGDNTETGPGVLTRVRFRAIAAGQSSVAIGYDVNDMATYPIIIDYLAEVIPMQRVLGGIVAIGQDCPTGGGGNPLPPSEQDPPAFETPTPGPDAPPDGATPGPDGATPGPDDTPGPDASPSPSGSPRPSGSPSPSASPGSGTDDDEDDDGGSDLLLIIGALVLAFLGIAAAGAGAWFLLRRVEPQPPAGSDGPPPEQPEPPDSGDNP